MKSTAEIQNMQKWFKICGVVLAILMGRVWEHVQAQRLGRQVLALRLDADKLTYENGRLQVQIHQFISPSHLEVLAKERSMAPLKPAQRIGIQR